MPVKFKKSHKEYKRGVSASNQKMKHYYMKTTPKQELIDYINSNNAKPKIRQKCLNELTRRGVKLVWKRPEKEAI
tara:strand:+ start:721 stop:945 length:225 start_codon:yes stop_codon:yes gene_type:complete